MTGPSASNTPMSLSRRRGTVMQITRFCPSIISPKADEVIAVLEALGFERRHQKKGINDEDITSIAMKNADGFSVMVTQVDADQVPRDLTTIQMNVRDFDEAYELLESKGFKNSQGDKVTETGSSKSTMMISPSGFSIVVSEHIRK